MHGIKTQKEKCHWPPLNKSANRSVSVSMTMTNQSTTFSLKNIENHMGHNANMGNEKQKFAMFSNKRTELEALETKTKEKPNKNKCSSNTIPLSM